MKFFHVTLGLFAVGCVAEKEEDARCIGETIICTIAGTGDQGYNHQDQSALDTDLNFPNALAFDGNGDLLINDSRNFLIRRIEGENLISAVGKVANTYAQTGPALQSPLFTVSDISVGPDGLLYIVEGQGHQVSVVDLDSSELTVIAGIQGISTGFNEGEVPLEEAEFDTLSGVAVGDDGTIYVADSVINIVRAITTDDTVITVAGADAEGFPLLDEADPNRLESPQKLAFYDGTLYIADSARHRIVSVNLDTGELTNVVGATDIRGYMGDGSEAVSAQLAEPYGFAFNAAGRMIIADTGNDALRAVFPDGTIDTVAGRGATGYDGDTEASEGASLNSPMDVAYEADGDLVFADKGNAVVRRISQPTW
jgi:sugar lactone lactonase YvrE